MTGSCCRNAVSTQYLKDLKPESVMCIWKTTVQHKIPVHIPYIKPMKWNLQIDVGYTIGLQLSSHMYFYFLFYWDKNNLGS